MDEVEEDGDEDDGMSVTSMESLSSVALPPTLAGRSGDAQINDRLEIVIEDSDDD